MKKLLTAILITALVVSHMATSVFAADYNFGTGYEADAFGKPTTSDVAPDYSSIENIRRDKNSAYFPPSYGVFSGDIPTDPTSRYHEQDSGRSTVSSITSSGIFSSEQGEFMASTSTSNPGSYISDSGVANYSAGDGSFYYSYSQQEEKTVSVPLYSDGSIGSISIPKLSLNVKVYEGTDLDTMKRGVGHFTFTSQWSGNVGLASHNRGSASHFKGIWNLENGDEITYTTKAGTRTYYVFNKQKIDETDLSYLTASGDNMLTLITCVENQSGLRWLIQAK